MPYICYSVLDLNAFERQNKAESLGMVTEEGSSEWKRRSSVFLPPFILTTTQTQSRLVNSSTSLPTLWSPQEQPLFEDCVCRPPCDFTKVQCVEYPPIMWIWHTIPLRLTLLSHSQASHAMCCAVTVDLRLKPQMTKGRLLLIAFPSIRLQWQSLPFPLQNKPPGSNISHYFQWLNVATVKESHYSDVMQFHNDVLVILLIQQWLVNVVCQ